jgi:hypothetical protein
MFFRSVLYNRSFLPWAVTVLSASRALAADCGDLSTPKAVLDCLLKNDPRILASAEQVKRAEALSRAAGAWSNPEAEGEYSRAENGAAGGKISASLSQKIEWGSGAKTAEMEREVRRAEDRLLRQEILGEAVLRLVRLTQIREERELVEGQVKLCERGLQRFKGLAFLTAEQKAGKQALEWGQDRLRLELLDLESEAGDIRLELSVGLDGRDVPAEMDIPHKSVWAAWPSPAERPSFLMVETYRWHAARAKAGKEAASALPAISLGPVFEREEGGLSATNFWGARLSLGLPLWDRNEGNRDAAESSAREMGIRESSAEFRLSSTRRLLKERYEKAVERLAGLEERVETGGVKLGAIRTDYLEGRLALPLALEAYREMEELLKHFHATERRAYESLWRGYALEDVAEGQTP